MFVYRYRLHRAAVLVGALCTALFASAAAQNTSSTNHPGCRTGPDEFDSNASVNSTGKVKFQFDDDVNYIFSVTYNDTRRESTEEVRITPEVLHDINGWISMPNGTSGYICVYKFLGLNASSPEEDLNGCGGVLSEACVDKIKEMSIPINSDGSGRCPLLDVRIRELRGACGNRLTLQQSSSKWLEYLDSSHYRHVLTLRFSHTNGFGKLYLLCSLATGSFYSRRLPFTSPVRIWRSAQCI